MTDVDAGPRAPGTVAVISWGALTLMTVSSVASLRPAPTMALYGLACVFLFYFPTLLAFVASTFAYVVAPGLAASGIYTAIVIVVVYWAGVFLSLRGGIGVVAKLSASGVLVGTIIPGLLLVVLGVLYLADGNPSAAPMDAGALLPEWDGVASIVLVVSNFGAYAGMEMNAVHVNELEELVYIWMFIAAYRLRRLQPGRPRGYLAPALPLLCGAGALSSVAAIAIGFVPPSQFGEGGELTYFAVVLGGILLLAVAVPYVLVRMRTPDWRSPKAGAEAAS